MWGVYTNTRGGDNHKRYQGHTFAESAKIKRNGEHMQFKRKRDAIQWMMDNESKYGGCNLFVRKVSKRIV